MARARSRTKDSRYSTTGTYKFLGVEQTEIARSLGTNVSTDDTIGFLKRNNPFLTTRTVFRTGRLTGSPTGAITDVDTTLLAVPTFPTPPVGFLPAINSTYLNKGYIEALASSNPSAADANLPQFLAELGQDPILEGLGNLLTRKPAAFLSNFSKYRAKALKFRQSQQLRQFGRKWSKPVAPPVTMFESLKNLPAMVYAHGHRILSEIPKSIRSAYKGQTFSEAINDLSKRANRSIHLAAGGYLYQKFAIDPTVGDLQTLLNFAANVERRKAMLRNLRDKKALRRSVTLGTNSTVVISNENQVLKTSLSPVIVRGQYIDNFYWKQWASVYYRLKSSAVLPESDRGMDALASRLVLGLTVDSTLDAAWELMPWSWLIDWFGNFGDYLQMTNNSLPCYAQEVCLMRTAFARRDYRPIPVGMNYSGESYCERTEKRRNVIPSSQILAMPTLSIPAFSAGQWSILGSLAIVQNPFGFGTADEGKPKSLSKNKWFLRNKRKLHV